MNQTDKDPRILVAVLAHSKLKIALFSKSIVKPGISKDEVNKALDTIESQLMSMKFSYMNCENLAGSQFIESIYEQSKTLYEGYKECIEKGMSDLPRANAIWAFQILSGLGRRFGAQGDKPTIGIDLISVKVRNITENDNLFIMKCVAGSMEFTIVTNIQGLDIGDTLRAALLPPAIVGGTVSEAMFLGDERIYLEPGTFIQPMDADTKEADGILFNEIRKI